MSHHSVAVEKRFSEDSCREMLSLTWKDTDPIKAALLKYCYFDNGCIMWARGCHNRGYGRINIDGKPYSVHRVSAHLYLDMPIDSELCACHTCDNPRCFRPSHLFIGTHQENMEDYYNKKRQRL